MNSPSDPPLGQKQVGRQACVSGKQLLALALLCVILAVGWLLRDQLTLRNLASHEAAFQDLLQSRPVLVYAGLFLVYVAVTGLSLPGATPMTLVIGWLLGFWRGVVLISFASTAGASIAFLLSRYLFRDAIKKQFGERLVTFNLALEKEGPFYLFSLRLIPAVPFFIINIVMGLTPMSLLTYWWVSQLGMLPGTMAYVYAGASVPDLNTLSEQGVRGILSPQLFTAFVLLGLFPFLVRWGMRLVLRGHSIPASLDPE